MFNNDFENAINTQFSKNLRFFLEKNNLTQLEFSKKMNVSTATVSNWCKGIKSPRMDKVDLMCKIFNCRRSDLIEDRSSLSEESSYYLNPDARDMAQFLFENPEYKVLFDASRKVKPEDIQFVREMIDRMSNRD